MTDDEQFDDAGFSTAGHPLCPFCSAPWSDSAVRAYDLDAGDHCASGRFYPECCTISISCENCGREMYRKEGFEFK